LGGGGLLAGLDIALTGLEAQQATMDVTAHNIANANNPAYAREQVDLVPGPPYNPPGLGQPVVPGQFQAGVQVAQVQRDVSHFLQAQGWATAGGLAASQEQAQVLGQVQALFDEPSSDGLGAALNQFWQDWQSLSNDPSNAAAAAQVLAQGQTVATAFNTLSQGLTALRQSLDQQVGAAVSQVDQLAQQIATLNGSIASAQAAGATPTDLEDARDQLIGQLASLVPVQVTWNPDGTVTVDSGGANLVAGTTTLPLSASPDPANGDLLAVTLPGGTPFVPTGGQLGALLALRDQTIPADLTSLDQLAAAFAEAVNQQHAQGSTASGTPVAGTPAQDFFAVPPGGITAADLQVNPYLLQNPGDLAVAATPSGGPGDGTNARAIADLENQPVVGSSTVGQAYAALVGQVGAQVQAAQQAENQAQTLATAIQQQAQSIQGVSLDEEMVHMVAAQNAYAAAAKVASAIDAMLATVIGMVS
jgi:flagellar hook-associated protein 1 FlgK